MEEAGNPTVPVEVEILRELLVNRDALVRAITAGMTSGNWDQVMGPFDALLGTIQRAEAALEAAGRRRPS